MNQFTADIAAMLEIALAGAGLVVLYFALKESSKLMKAAACVMLIGSVLGLLCTGYWWFKYYKAGIFDNPADSTVHMIHYDDELKHYYPPQGG